MVVVVVVVVVVLVVVVALLSSAILAFSPGETGMKIKSLAYGGKVQL